MDSILDSVKKMLGIDASDTSFDTDVLIQINSALNILTQLGVGPEDGFAIEDSGEKWSNLIGDNKLLNLIKSYVYLKVRMAFDPPTSSTAADSFKSYLSELEWRINVTVDPKTTI